MNADRWKTGEAYLRILWPAMLGLGILLRLLTYLQNRSLFLDEANLARNIAEAATADLFAPLAYQQYAPPLFLLLEKINFLLLGSSEWSLRFWPLLMGILALVGIYRLLREEVGRGLPELFVFYLFAFSQVFIRYSTELKQYSTDMAVATWLIWAALRYPPGDRKGGIMWAVGGSLALWLSMPSVFVLAGIGLYFILRRRRRTITASWITLLLIGCCWILQFGWYYLSILSHDVQQSDLLNHHQHHFWPLWPDQVEEWQRIGALTESMLSTLIGHTVPAVLLGAAGLVMGGLHLRKRPELLSLLLVPVLLCLLASGLERYSLMERLSLFMMPALGLTLAYGLQHLWSASPMWAQTTMIIIFVAILPLRRGWQYFFHPLKYEEMRTVLAELAPQLRPEDCLWIDHNARPAFLWYTRYHDPQGVWGRPPETIVFSTWDGLAAQEIPASAAEGKQVWLLFSHLVSDVGRAAMEEDLSSMNDRHGPAFREIRQPGVAAFAFRPVPASQ